MYTKKGTSLLRDKIQIVNTNQIIVNKCEGWHNSISSYIIINVFSTTDGRVGLWCRVTYHIDCHFKVIIIWSRRCSFICTSDSKLKNKCTKYIHIKYKRLSYLTKINLCLKVILEDSEFANNINEWKYIFINNHKLFVSN
jgi:hypothetical protein